MTPNAEQFRTVFTKLLAVVTEDLTVTGCLVTAVGAMTAGVGALYRDCKKDREKLWQHIRDLERKIARL